MLKSALCSRQCWQGSFLPWSLSCMFGSCQLIACLSLASWTLCACKLSVWKLFVPVLIIMRVFFHLEMQNILFSYSSKWSHLYFSFHDSWNFRVSLIGAAAGIVGVVLLSWSCFPLKKVLSDLWTCFCLDISASCTLKENMDAIKVWKRGKPSYWILQCISFQSRTLTVTCETNTLYFLLDVFEAFVFGNSLFASTLLAIFGKIEIKGIIYRGNFTLQEDQWQKNPLVLGNSYSFSTSGRPLSSSTEEDYLIYR